jgi:nicotinate-nucleotide adenylyltransferase
MRIAICGGTFDPFHRGHEQPLLAVRDKMQWDHILYIPAWRQPFKADRDSASGYHRMAMIALAIRDNDNLFVSPIELERGGTSYSVDTLEALRPLYPRAEFDWVIGDDNVADLSKWKNPERLFQLARFVVLSRVPEGVVRGPQPAPANLVYAENATVPISSTEIRRRVRAGEPIDSLVDPLVSRYIHHYHLYKEGHS